MNSFEFMFHVAKKVSLAFAIVFSVLSLLLCWVGFSVPDWLVYEDVTLVKKKFGLWTICSQSRTSQYPVYRCEPWPQAQDQLPDFIRTTQALITLGCISCTAAVIVGIFAVIFKNGYGKILPLAAGILCLLTFMFVLIGISVFGSDHALYAEKLAGKSYNRRWGYWIFVPAIFFLLFATFFFPLSFLSNTSKNDNDQLKKPNNHQNSNGVYPSLAMGGNQPVNRTMDFNTSNGQSQYPSNFNMPFRGNNQVYPGRNQIDNLYRSGDTQSFGNGFRGNVSSSSRPKPTEKKWVWERIKSFSSS